MGEAPIKKTSTPTSSGTKDPEGPAKKEASTETFGRLVHQVVSGPVANYKQDRKP